MKRRDSLCCFACGDWRRLKQFKIKSQIIPLWNSPRSKANDKKFKQIFFQWNTNCCTGGGEPTGKTVCNNRNDHCESQQGKISQDQLDEMLCLAVNLIQNRSKEGILQTERLPDKLKSDIERTLDGIFAHRFLLFYSSSFFLSNHTWMLMNISSTNYRPLDA